jgi:hypothetical protein
LHTAAYYIADFIYVVIYVAVFFSGHGWSLAK